MDQANNWATTIFYRIDYGLSSFVNSDPLPVVYDIIVPDGMISYTRVYDFQLIHKGCLFDLLVFFPPSMMVRSVQTNTFFIFATLLKLWLFSKR